MIVSVCAALFTQHSVTLRSSRQDSGGALRTAAAPQTLSTTNPALLAECPRGHYAVAADLRTKIIVLALPPAQTTIIIDEFMPFARTCDI